MLLLPLHKTATYYYFCRESSRLAIDWGADVAHAHDLNTLFAAKWVKDKLGSKVVYDSHELWLHRNRVGRKARFEKKLDQWVERHLIPHADAVITVCDSIGDWLVNTYSGLEKPYIVRNIPYRLTAAQASESEGFKEKLGIPKERITVIYTGKFTTGRGISSGLRLVQELDGFHFVMLGYGDEGFMARLDENIERMNIRDKVTICPPVPYSEVTSFIAGADLALVYIEPVCLSYEFALPNKLFESIQAGIPILGAGLVEIRKLVDSIGAGICFGSEAELIERVSRVTPNQIEEWRENTARVRETLTWEEEVKVLFACYDGLQ